MGAMHRKQVLMYWWPPAELLQCSVIETVTHPTGAGGRLNTLLRSGAQANGCWQRPGEENVDNSRS